MIEKGDYEMKKYGICLLVFCALFYSNNRAQGATTKELIAQLEALMAQIQTLQAQLSLAQGTPSGVFPSSLLTSGNLIVGSRGAAVKDLQRFLNGAGYQIAASGVGSLGNETEYFGSLTKATLVKWQAANGVSPALGYFGPITRTKLSSLVVAPTTPTTPTTPVSAGTGLTVSLAADQPVESLAPGDAARIPFTKLQLIASSDGDITVNSIEVERVGLRADAALASVLLLDANGNQLGLKKTLNSDHKASVGEPFVVKAGQTVSVIVAANRGAVGGAYGGQALALKVMKVNTSAQVNGAFPLTGTTYVVNETLTIGSVTMARASLDPGASQTKEIGTASYTFSSVKVTAGSAEKIYLKSIRWNQTGSAGSGDLANVKTYIDGTAYDATVSSDGKYYTSTFPATGVLIEKGFSKEISIKGDIVGGSSRTIDFDVYDESDLYVIGETYGYGVTASSSANSPFYDGKPITVVDSY